MKIPEQERYSGALVGVLVGDALGAPYETWPAMRVREDMAKRGGLVPFDYPDPWNKDGIFPAGRPTDDSDHTAALAESLIACLGVNQEDIFFRLRKVVIGGESPLWEGKAIGAGRTTKAMLRPAFWEESRALPALGAFPSNGSLMRSAPLALLFKSSKKGIDAEDVRRMSSVTHRHPLASECCLAYIAVLYALLKGYSPNEAIEFAFPLVEDEALLRVLDNPAITPRDPEKWPGRGAALLTLHTGLWALTTSTYFGEGIERVVALGGDTDTYAAVAGGLLGALYGARKIPPEWVRVLKGKDKMESLALELYNLRNK